MNIHGTSKIDIQELLDMAIELENYKTECEKMAERVAGIRALIKEREDKAFDEIDANSFISFPSCLFIEDVANVLGLDYRAMERDFIRAGKHKREFLQNVQEEGKDA